MMKVRNIDINLSWPKADSQVIDPNPGLSEYPSCVLILNCLWMDDENVSGVQDQA